VCAHGQYNQQVSKIIKFKYVKGMALIFVTMTAKFVLICEEEDFIF